MEPYRILIPSYKRSERQPTLELLSSAYTKEDIVISTQCMEDYDKYYKLYSDRATVIYKEGNCVGDNRNTLLDYACGKGIKRCVMLDDDITGFLCYNKVKIKDGKNAKELCHNGSCCGLPPTWNYSRGQFCEALQLCKKNGQVTWDEIAQDIESLHSSYEFRKATSFNSTGCERRAHYYGMSMASYMRWLWNNPQNGQSPYKMFEGVMQPSGKDANGNLIYRYAPERTF